MSAYPTPAGRDREAILLQHAPGALCPLLGMTRKAKELRSLRGQGPIRRDEYFARVIAFLVSSCQGPPMWCTQKEISGRAGPGCGSLRDHDPPTLPFICRLPCSHTISPASVTMTPFRRALLAKRTKRRACASVVNRIRYSGQKSRCPVRRCAQCRRSEQLKWTHLLVERLGDIPRRQRMSPKRG
jgi:hypothetical protein